MNTYKLFLVKKMWKSVSDARKGKTMEKKFSNYLILFWLI